MIVILEYVLYRIVLYMYIGPILLNYNLSLAQIEVMFAKKRHHFQRCRLRSLENLSGMKFCLKSDTFLPVLILKKSMANYLKSEYHAFVTAVDVKTGRRTSTTPLRKASNRNTCTNVTNVNMSINQTSRITASPTLKLVSAESC